MGLVLLVVGCGGASSEALDSMLLPDSREGIEEMLRRLPRDFEGDGGIEQFGPSDLRVSYQADGVSVRVFDVSSGELWPPGTSAGTALDTYADGADWEVLATGGEGERSWVRIQTEGTDTAGRVEDKYGVVVGDRSESWLFTLSARSATELDELVALFVSAATAGD